MRDREFRRWSAGLVPEVLDGSRAWRAAAIQLSHLQAGTKLSPRHDSIDFVPPAPATLAGYFPHLEIIELLGQGGMGAVYKARQPKLDRIVALKIIRPESAATGNFAERFNREARSGSIKSPTHRGRLRVRRGNGRRNRHRRAAASSLLFRDGVRRWREFTRVNPHGRTHARAGAGDCPADLRGCCSSPTTRGSSIATSSRKTSYSTSEGE